MSNSSQPSALGLAVGFLRIILAHRADGDAGDFMEILDTSIANVALRTSPETCRRGWMKAPGS